MVDVENRKTILFERQPEMAENFFKAVSLGLSLKTACDLVGMSLSNVYVWREIAQKDMENGLTIEESAYIKFENDYRKAKASFQARNLSRIDEAGKQGSWQASAWLLERRCPEEFALKQNVNLESDTITIVHDIPNTKE